MQVEYKRFGVDEVFNLRDCPFCDSDPEIQDNSHAIPVAGCFNLKCPVSPSVRGRSAGWQWQKESVEGAVFKWNQRS